MKKISAIVICIILVISLCACTGGVGKNSKLSIVTTIFPEYDWVKQILGDNSDNADITMLLDNGVDLHSYQPTADDIIKISACDMFIYVGGESDGWVDGVLKEVVNKDIVVINLLEVLGDKVKAEEVKEGMEAEEKNEPEPALESEPEYDEHVWLSVKNAKILCGRISEALCELDAKNAAAYKRNTAAYIEKLDLLDKNYEETVNASPTKALVFGDRFPFRYLTDDYGIDYFAAFVGCSAESEASFKTVIFLANKIDELGLDSIIKIEGSSDSLPKTINENTKAKSAKILTVNSMQSVTAEQMNEGLTYIGICEKNLEVLKEALK